MTETAAIEKSLKIRGRAERFAKEMKSILPSADCKIYYSHSMWVNNIISGSRIFLQVRIHLFDRNIYGCIYADDYGISSIEASIGYKFHSNGPYDDLCREVGWVLIQELNGGWFCRCPADGSIAAKFLLLNKDTFRFSVLDQIVIAEMENRS